MSMHSNIPQSNQKQEQPAKRGPLGGEPMGGGPGGGMMRGGEKARDFKGTMSTLIQYLAEYKTKIILVLLAASTSTIFSILSPKILGKATTKLYEGVVAQIAGTGTGIDFTYIGQIMLLLIGLYLLSALLSYTQGCFF